MLIKTMAKMCKFLDRSVCVELANIFVRFFKSNKI